MRAGVLLFLIDTLTLLASRLGRDKTLVLLVFSPMWFFLHSRYSFTLSPTVRSLDKDSPTVSSQICLVWSSLHP